MKNELDQMIDYLPQLTKDEAELIASVCLWSNEMRSAFLWAKNIFEGKYEEEMVELKKKRKRGAYER